MMSLKCSCSAEILEQIYSRFELAVNKKLTEFTQVFDNKINSLHDDICNMQDRFDDCFDVLHAEITSRYTQVENTINDLQSNEYSTQEQNDENFSKLNTEISSRQDYLVERIESLNDNICDIRKNKDKNTINSNVCERNENNLNHIISKVKSLEDKIETIKENFLPLSDFISDCRKNFEMDCNKKILNSKKINTSNLVKLQNNSSTSDNREPFLKDREVHNVNLENCLVIEFRDDKEIDESIVPKTCSNLLERDIQIVSQETLYKKSGVTAIKFHCQNLKDKVDLLKYKSMLKGTNCYIRKYDSTTERLTKQKLYKLIKRNWKAEKISVKDNVVFVDGERFLWKQIDSFELSNVKPVFLHNTNFLLRNNKN